MFDLFNLMPFRSAVFACVLFASIACGSTPPASSESGTQPPLATERAVISPAPTGTPRGDRPPPPPIARRIVDLVAQHDVAGLVSSASTQERPCVVSAEGSPKCEGSDREGTLYRVFPSASCQGFWTRNVQAVMEGVSRASAAPYAVAQLGPTPDWAQASGIPFGDHLVIFEPSSGPDRPEAVALFLKDGAIVRAQVGCRRADQFLEPGSGESQPIVIWQ